MKKIKLHGKYGREKYALVDDEDYELVSQYRWHVDRRGYARFVTQTKDLEYVQIFMHQLVMGFKPEPRFGKPRPFIDHRDGNPLNNTRANLRFCTRSQNAANGKKYARGHSRSKGVLTEMTTKGLRYRAQVVKDGKRYRTGTFDNEHHAALFHDLFAIGLHGEFARTNFPVVSQSL